MSRWSDGSYGMLKRMVVLRDEPIACEILELGVLYLAGATVVTVGEGGWYQRVIIRLPVRRGSWEGYLSLDRYLLYYAEVHGMTTDRPGCRRDTCSEHAAS